LRPPPPPEQICDNLPCESERMSFFSDLLQQTAGTAEVLDYPLARYYSNMLGRFVSPDPLKGNMLNPQRLNRYVYALNGAYRPCGQNRWRRR